jgi:hypothetical protein
MKRSRSPTPPLPRAPDLFEMQLPFKKSRRVPPSAFPVTHPSRVCPPGHATTALVQQAPPPPEQRSDSDVQEYLELQLNKEFPSLTLDANLYMEHRYMHFYQAMVLAMMNLQLVCAFCDMTLVTAIATVLRVFNRKNIDMTKVEGFEAVCFASVFLACGMYEDRHEVSDVRLRVRVTYEEVYPGSDKFDRVNAMTFPVFQDIGFTLAPTALHFLEAACRQCTPSEVTVAKAEELFRSLVQHFVRLTMLVSCHATFLPSEVCFGCAFAARQMLNFQADVTITPVERFNMDQVRLVCEKVTEGYTTDLWGCDSCDSCHDMKKALKNVQKDIESVASEIHALLHTNCAAGAPSGSEPPT